METATTRRVLTTPALGGHSVLRDDGNAARWDAIPSEGFGLLCCISSHVMNLTSVESLARDLTHYAGIQLGFDAVAVPLVLAT